MLLLKGFEFAIVTLLPVLLNKGLAAGRALERFDEPTQVEWVLFGDLLISFDFFFDPKKYWLHYTTFVNN
jgi:hypothetical protein